MLDRIIHLFQDFTFCARILQKQQVLRSTDNPPVSAETKVFIFNSPHQFQRWSKSLQAEAVLILQLQAVINQINLCFIPFVFNSK